MKREQWEVITASGAQVFDTYAQAVGWLSGQTQGPAMLHRVSRTHVATYGVPGGMPWPQAAPAAPAPNQVGTAS